MSVKMYLSWRTKQRKFSPLGAKHHFLLLFCPPVRLHLHKREMGLYSQTGTEEYNGWRASIGGSRITEDAKNARCSRWIGFSFLFFFYLDCTLIFTFNFIRS